ncbi:hypothetical protein PYCC9005_004254 [Savitreella phatthalungensis]
MNHMLGLDDSHIPSSYEHVNEHEIDQTPQRFKLIPEALDMTPEQAAQELGKKPSAERHELKIRKFLQNSAYEKERGSRRSGDEKVDESRSIAGASITAPARWEYHIHLKGKTDKRQLVRSQSGELLTASSGS